SSLPDASATTLYPLSLHDALPISSHRDLCVPCSPRSHAMSRGFDGPEIDDFQNPARDVSRGPESNSRAGWDTVRRLERIRGEEEDRKSTRLNSSHGSISYAVFCLK